METFLQDTFLQDNSSDSDSDIFSKAPNENENENENENDNNNDNNDSDEGLKPTKIEDLRPTHHNTPEKLYFKDFATKDADLKKETLYRSILLNASLSDCGTVNYNKYGTQGFKLQPISPIFADNILLGCCIPDTPELVIRTIKENNKEGKLKVKQDLIDNQRQPILTFLNRNNIKILPSKICPLRVVPMDGKPTHFQPLNANQLGKLYKNFYIPITPETELKAVMLIYKVELSSLSYEDVLKLFSKDNLYGLEEQHYYIADVDFTKDFTGSFDRALLIKHLTENLGFNIQAPDNKKTKDYDGGFLDEHFTGYTDKTIINNVDTVGRNCLTFMYKDARYKIYNKFVNNIECKGVKDPIGSNLVEWSNNPSSRLRECIPQSLEHGYTRLEITFYRNNTTNTLPPKEYIEQALKELEELIPPNITFSTSIANQWKAYTECIRNNVLIVDLHNKSLCLCYSVNQITKRITGYTTGGKKSKKHNEEQEPDADNKEINLKDFYYILTYCTMDVPILVLIIDIFEEGIIKPPTAKTTQKGKDKLYYLNISYRNIITKPKDGDKLTYLFTNNNLYYALETQTTKNQPADVSLLDTNHIRLRIHDTNLRRTVRATKYKFDEHFLGIWINTPRIEFKKQLTKAQVKEIQSEQKFIETYDNIINDATIYNNKQLETYIQNKRILEAEAESNNHILNIVNNKVPKSLITFPISSEFSIIAIVKTSLKYGLYNKSNEETFLLITDNDDFIKAPQNVNNYIKACINNNSLVFNKQKIIRIGEDVLMSFTLDRIYTNNGVSYAQISRIIPNTKLKDLAKTHQDTINNISKEIKEVKLENDLLCGNVKERTCKKIDDLEEGTQLFITAFKKKEGKLAKDKYIFTADGHKDIFISNTHLEHYIKLKGLPEHKFKLIVGCFKTTKTKQKLRSVIIN